MYPLRETACSAALLDVIMQNASKSFQLQIAKAFVFLKEKGKKRMDLFFNDAKFQKKLKKNTENTC